MEQNRSLLSNVARVCLVLPLLIAMSAGAQVLEFVEEQRDGVGGVDGLAGPRFVALSPDGRHVYVAAEGDNAVSIFERHPATGALTFVDAVFDNVGGVDGLAGATALAVSPDGKHVVVGSAFEAAVAVFERNPRDGTLDFVEAQFNGVGGITGLVSVVWVSVSPDGKNVYASGFFGFSVVVFERNSQDGTLTYLETQTNGVNGVNGIAGTFGHAVSPDGHHFYATGLLDSAVATFERNQDGTLTFVEALFDGVAFLKFARTVALSPDGRYAYFAAADFFPPFDTALTVFARDKVSGRLSFVDSQFYGPGSGLFFLTNATLNSGGTLLVTSSFGDDAVAVLERDPATGLFEFLEAEFNNVGGVSGILGPVHLTTSPDGRHIYAPGFQDDAMGVFEVHQSGR